MNLLNLIFLINFFEFKPYFGKKSIIFLPYEISYNHFGSYGVATDNNISFFYDSPSYDLGFSLSILFDEGISSREFYAKTFAYGGLCFNLFFQKKFIKNYNLFLPFNIRLPFEEFNSQFRTLKSFKPSFKFSPSYYIFVGENLKPGIKVEGIWSISGERSLYQINPLFETVLFPEKIVSLSFSFKYRNIFSSGKSFSYPEIKSSIFSHPFPSLFMFLSGFISFKAGENPFAGGLRGDYLYGEPVLKRGAGFEFGLGLVFYPVKKRKIEIYVRDEDGNPLSPFIEENPHLGLKKKETGTYEKIDAVPDTYFIKFSVREFKDTFIYIYPEDIKREYSKFYVVMKKIEVYEVEEKREVLKPLEIPQRFDFYFYFDSARAEIREIYRDTFDLILKIFENIEEDSFHLKVVGDASPEGDTLFNRRLSYERAERVSNFLKLMIPKNKFFIFEIKSEYDSKLKPSDLPKKDWKLKRRAYLKIVKPYKTKE